MTIRLFALVLLCPGAAWAQWEGSQDLEPGLDPEEILLFEDFERDGFGGAWSSDVPPGPDTVEAPPEYVFAGARSLVLTGRTGEHYSEGAGEWGPYDQDDEGIDAAYTRAYVRLEDGFDLGSCIQLKLFGWFAGSTIDDTHGTAGNPPDGTNHASALLAVDNDMALHFYVYFPEQEDIWGDYMYLDVGGQAYLEPGRWFLLETYFALNTPGRYDGHLMAWVDGELKGDIANIRFRDVEGLVLRRLDFEDYFGGDGPENTSPRDQRIFYDEVVVSRGAIGAFGGGDADADADSDADTDADADADADADTDADADADADTDADADAGAGAGPPLTPASSACLCTAVGASSVTGPSLAWLAVAALALARRRRA